MYETPQNYTDILHRYGGQNIYGEDNFILSWGRKAIKRLAVPDAFLGPYLEKWVLAEWTPPEEFGSPTELESLKIDFPTRGLYLPYCTYPAIDSEELNPEVLKATIWVIMNHKHDTLMNRYYTMKDEFDRVKAEETRQLVDRIEDGAPAFLESCSFTGQLNVNSVVKQKLEILERNLPKISDIARRFPRSGAITQPSEAQFYVKADV